MAPANGKINRSSSGWTTGPHLKFSAVETTSEGACFAFRTKYIWEQ